MRLPTGARKAECSAVCGTHRENSLSADTASSLRPLKQRWVWSTRAMLVYSLAAASICLAKASCSHTLKGSRSKVLKKSATAFFQKKIFFFPAETQFPSCSRGKRTGGSFAHCKGNFCLLQCQVQLLFCHVKRENGRVCLSWPKGTIAGKTHCAFTTTSCSHLQSGIRDAWLGKKFLVSKWSPPAMESDGTSTFLFTPAISLPNWISLVFCPATAKPEHRTLAAGSAHTRGCASGTKLFSNWCC